MQSAIRDLGLYLEFFVRNVNFIQMLAAWKLRIIYFSFFACHCMNHRFNNLFPCKRDQKPSVLLPCLFLSLFRLTVSAFLFPSLTYILGACRRGNMGRSHAILSLGFQDKDAHPLWLALHCNGSVNVAGFVIEKA